MNYRGVIALDRELSYTQAQQIGEYCAMEHTNKPYRKACLQVSPNGRGLQWNGAAATHMAEAIADIISRFLAPWKIIATGVITVSGTKKEAKYEIVVLNQRVKIYKGGQIGGQIETISPTKT